jgi:hypothetical protein
MVVREIQHTDGTTTVFEKLEGGSWKIYTIDSDTGVELDGAPWAEFGANYTIDEITPGYERPDDPAQGDSPPELQSEPDPPLEEEAPAAAADSSTTEPVEAPPTSERAPVENAATETTAETTSESTSGASESSATESGGEEGESDGGGSGGGG